MKGAALPLVVLAACGRGGGAPGKSAEPEWRAPEVATASGTIDAAPAIVPPDVAPEWALPPGWRAETIPFPLEFAPTLPYRGVEELRFPKEFFTVGHADYFSYAFVWYLAPPGPASVETLEQELVSYFAGLARAVGGADRPDIAAFEFKAELTGDLATRVRGVVDAFDAFKAQAPVRLHIEIWPLRCERDDRLAFAFAASPRDPGAHVMAWRWLVALAADARCEDQAPSPSPAADPYPASRYEAPPPPLPPMPWPTPVPPAEMDKLQLVGSRELRPPPALDAAIRRFMRRTGVSPGPRGAAGICVDQQGEVIRTRIMKSSGYAPYDRYVLEQLATWRFRPYVIRGRAHPVCESFNLFLAR